MTEELTISGGIDRFDGEEFDSDQLETEFFEWLESKGFRFSGFSLQTETPE